MPDRKPSIHQIRPVLGYEKATFESKVVPPPFLEEEETDDFQRSDGETTVDGSLNNNLSFPELTRSLVKDRLRQHLKKERFLVAQALKHANITEITPSQVKHYCLKTFSEKRSLRWSHEAMTSEPADLIGTPPAPWDVQVTFRRDGPFMDGARKVEVPHTAQIVVCHECVGIGRTRCGSCKGEGGSNCLFCNGVGTTQAGWGQAKCEHCNGRGRNTCSGCEGHGQVKCDDCKKKCQLKYFLQLTVERKTHVVQSLDTSEYFLRGLPESVIIEAEGQTVFQETKQRVFPKSTDKFFHSSSEESIEKHATELEDQKVLVQTQCGRVIPVWEISYAKGEKTGHFFIYGTDLQTYIPRHSKRNTLKTCSVM